YSGICGETIERETCKILEGQVNGTPVTGMENRVHYLRRSQLMERGFSPDFIDALAGTGGGNAVEARVQWLADNAKLETWRLDASGDQRSRYLVEIGRLYPSQIFLVIDDIIGILNDTGDAETVRKTAAEVLGRHAENNPAARDALIRAAQNETNSLMVRQAAERALGGIEA
ncbi:MAG: HEAT repeat domain-containing protein, partial [bacterium]|nr:HEAT repeat domain-containing protein [bacterium]